MPTYQHTQKGTMIRVAMVLTTVFTALGLIPIVLFGSWPLAVVLGASLVLLLATAWLVGSLTVQVTDQQVKVWFGPGLIHKEFPVRDIESVRIVRNPWYYGWGIRLTPHGWLWNVSGLDAVELELRGGQKFRIGTDEPQQLAAAIEPRT